MDSISSRRKAKSVSSALQNLLKALLFQNPPRTDPQQHIQFSIFLASIRPSSKETQQEKCA